MNTKLVANFLGQFWVSAIGFVFVPVYLKYLGVEAYGIVGFMATLQAWMSVLDFGMTPTVGREMSRVVAGAITFSEGRRVFFTMETLVGGIAALGAVMVVSMSPWITSAWLKTESLDLTEVQVSVAVIGMVVALRFVIALYRGAALGLQDAENFNIATAVMATMRGVGAIGAMIMIAPTLTVFVLSQLLVTFLEATYFAFRLRALLPAGAHVRRFDITIVKSLWRFSAGVSVTAILAVALTQLDKLLLSTLLPLKQFSTYFVASTLAGVVLVLVGPISATVYPKLSLLYASRKDGVADEYHAASQLVAAIVFPAMCVSFFFSEELLALWTRNAVLAHEAAPLFSILVVGSGLNALMQIPYALQLSHGWIGLGMRFNLVASVFIVPAILVVVPAFGAKGAAFVWFFLNLLYVFIVIPCMHRRLLSGQLMGWYVQDNLWPALSAFFVTVAARYICPPEMLDGWRALVVILVIGAGALLAALLATSTYRRYVVSLVEERVFGR